MFSLWPSCKFDHPACCPLQLIKPSQTFSHLHGNSGVTDICCHGDDIYSCGRNGHYCQFAVANGNQLQLLSSNKVIGCRDYEFFCCCEVYDGAYQLNVLHSFLLSYVTEMLHGINSLLHSVNLTLLLVHLILCISLHHSYHLALTIYHSLSLSLQTISVTNP